MTRARALADLGSASLATDAEVAAATSAVPTGSKNLLYNGAMQVHQRGASITGITTSTYGPADRWRFTPIGTFTVDIQNDAPAGSGFRKSTRVLCTTANAAPAASDHMVFVQGLEGQDLQRIAKGTSSAKQLTLSFWVKSNVTGTYVANLYDNDNTRWVSASYTISASATWEKKSITFPADTTGAFDNDNNASFYLHMFLGAGSNYTSGSLGTTWRAAAFANSDIAVGQVNLAAATNNYWQVTGVQLEVGDTATEFEHLPFGVELARCQRYFQRYSGYYNFPQSPAPVDVPNRAECHLYYSEKRANPSVTLSSTSHFTAVALTASYVANATSFGMPTGTGRWSGNMFFGVPATLSVNTPCEVYINDPAGYIDISAEL